MKIHQVLLLLFFVPGLAHSQKDIFDAARQGSVEDVKKLMAIEPDTINAISSSGYFPLTLACYNGNVEVALFLAEHVDDINGSTPLGTSLMAAVYKEHISLVELLLQMRADPNIPDDNGTTALHFAILNRNEIFVKLLIAAGADVAHKDNRGNSAIDYANLSHNQPIINHLKKNKI